MSASRLLHCKSSVNLTMSLKPDLHVQVSAFSLKVIIPAPAVAHLVALAFRRQAQPPCWIPWANRLMYRFAYWNDGPPPNATACAVCGGPHAQHWYVNGDVEASGGQIGVRWYEFRDTARPDR